MVRQIKQLNTIQVGPRLTKCPVCKKYTARVTSAVVSTGRKRTKLICYSSTCRSERFV